MLMREQIWLQVFEYVIEWCRQNITTVKMNKIVQNYALHQLVGNGNFGQVYRATHQRTKAQYAVKVIAKTSFKANPRLEQLALNQINILSALRNENIVRFVETLKTPNNFYFVYEYCNGGTLQSLLLSKKFLKESEALLILRQLLTAFKELYKNNIMHRDLKPDNIFLSDGKIKLGDFGFCKMLEMNMAQTMLGSPIYMAPQILKEEIYTLKADIWSLGVVLYEMLFGFCPFQSSSIYELINTIESSELKIPKDINPISQQIQALLLKMLKRDQFKRIQWSELFELKISNEGRIVPQQKSLSFQGIQRFLMNESPRKHTHHQPHFTQSVSLSSTTSPSIKKHKSQNLTASVEATFQIEVKQDSSRQEQAKKQFRERHDKWVQVISLLTELSESVNEDLIMHLLIVVLLKKINEASKDNPEWMDVVLEEKKCLQDALFALKMKVDIDLHVQKPEILKIWKKHIEKGKQNLNKAIRYIYDWEQNTTDIEILLLT